MGERGRGRRPSSPRSEEGPDVITPLCASAVRFPAAWAPHRADPHFSLRPKAAGALCAARGAPPPLGRGPLGVQGPEVL